MKIFTIITVLLLLSATGFAQKTDDENISAFTAEENQPTPIGGFEKIHSWIQKNVDKKLLKLDTLDCNNFKAGKVFIEFKINDEGKLNNPEIISGIGEPYDSEALRLIRQMPILWEPGRNNRMIFPFAFCYYIKESKRMKK